MTATDFDIPTDGPTVEEWLAGEPTDEGIDLRPVRALLDARDKALSPDGKHPWLDARLAAVVPTLLAEIDQLRGAMRIVRAAVAVTEEPL